MHEFRVSVELLEQMFLFKEGWSIKDCSLEYPGVIHFTVEAKEFDKDGELCATVRKLDGETLITWTHRTK